MEQGVGKWGVGSRDSLALVGQGARRSCQLWGQKRAAKRTAAAAACVAVLFVYFIYSSNSRNGNSNCSSSNSRSNNSSSSNNGDNSRIKFILFAGICKQGQ